MYGAHVSVQIFPLLYIWDCLHSM